MFIYYLNLRNLFEIEKPYLIDLLIASALVRSFAQAEVTTETSTRTVEVAFAPKVVCFQNETGRFLRIGLAHGFSAAPTKGCALPISLALGWADAGVSWLYLHLVNFTFLSLKMVIISEPDHRVFHFLFCFLLQFQLLRLVHKIIQGLHRFVFDFIVL